MKWERTPKQAKLQLTNAITNFENAFVLFSCMLLGKRLASVIIGLLLLEHRMQAAHGHNTQQANALINRRTLHAEISKLNRATLLLFGFGIYQAHKSNKMKQLSLVGCIFMACTLPKKAIRIIP